jgi:hypothetical protein
MLHLNNWRGLVEAVILMDCFLSSPHNCIARYLCIYNGRPRSSIGMICTVICVHYVSFLLRRFMGLLDD